MEILINENTALDLGSQHETQQQISTYSVKRRKENLDDQPLNRSPSTSQSLDSTRTEDLVLPQELSASIVTHSYAKNQKKSEINWLCST